MRGQWRCNGVLSEGVGVEGNDSKARQSGGLHTAREIMGQKGNLSDSKISVMGGVKV